MANQPSADSGSRMQAPVIRRHVIAVENSKAMLLKRQMPAFAVSGALHVLVIFALVFCFKMFPENDRELQASQAPTNTRLDEPPVPEPDLTLPDISVLDPFPGDPDPDLLKAEPAIVEPDSMSIPDEKMDFGPRQAAANPVLGDEPPGGSPGEIGSAPSGSGIGERDLLASRTGARKSQRLGERGGSDITEAAVARSLIWLARQQTLAGYWEFDGTSKEDHIAATGMCLLPFLAAGETHLTGKTYRQHVARGLDYLRTQLKPNGQFGGAGMYSHAIATIAFCEAAGMAQDDKLKRLARGAVEFIVRAQASNGSWGYIAGEPGDTSIVGWQVQALKSAKLAGIGNVDKALKQAESFLVSVSDDSESRYGYRTKGSSHTLSAVGLLSRIYMNGTARKAYVARGVKTLWDEHRPTNTSWDMYYYYYATQVFFFFDGKDWHQNWNPAIKKLLLDRQFVSGPESRSADAGSWPKDDGFIGQCCGKLGTTALACLTLEVYYRHLPLNKREAAGGLEMLEGNKK